MKADEIKKFREKHNLTQEELAKIVFSSVSAVRSWEQNQRNIPQSKIAFLENYEKYNEVVIQNSSKTYNEPIATSYTESQSEVKNEVQPANNSEVETLLREKMVMLEKNNALLEENKALLQEKVAKLEAEIQALKSVQSKSVNKSTQPTQSQPLIQPRR